MLRSGSLLSALVLCSRLAVAQPAVGITVFGTDQVSADQVRQQHTAALAELLQLERADRAAFEQKRNALELMLKGDRFSYVRVDLFRSYTDKVDFIIDVVEPRDAAKRLAYRTLVTRQFDDPQQLLAAWRDYSRESQQLFDAGEIKDMSCPVVHCTWSFHHPRLASFLLEFSTKAPANAQALTEILRTSDSERQREAAAYVLAHAGLSNDALVSALEPSIDDPSSLVRNAGMRVLYYAVRADSTLQIPLDKVVTALGFPSFTDRNKALVILRSLSRDRFSEAQLRSALPILLEILEKKDAHNYRNAHVVLKNLSGESFAEDETEKWVAWVRSAMR